MTNVAFAQTPNSEFSQVTGTMTYRQRVALSPSAVLRVRLVDDSRKAKPGWFESEVVLRTYGRQVPLAFTLPYRKADIKDNKPYAVQATLEDGNHVLFRTTQTYPVLTNGAGEAVTLTLTQITPQAFPASAASLPSLVSNRVWAVTSVSKFKHVHPGQTYTFLSGGTLVISSPKGEPSLGRWQLKKGIFSITEEGRRYPVTVLSATLYQIRLRINGPSPVEVTLVPARKSER